MVRKKVWDRFCSIDANSFEPTQKFFSGKYFTPDEIRLDRTLISTSKQNNLGFLTHQLFGPSAHPSTDNTDSHFDALYVKNFTKAEIKTALYTFNDEKAPGPNSVYFRILQLTHELTSQVFTRWVNLCLKFYCFSYVLRQADVAYFLK